MAKMKYTFPDEASTKAALNALHNAMKNGDVNRPDQKRFIITIITDKMLGYEEHTLSYLDEDGKPGPTFAQLEYNVKASPPYLLLDSGTSIHADRFERFIRIAARDHGGEPEKKERDLFS